MCARDGQHPLILEHLPGEPFGARVERQVGIEQGFDNGITSAEHVTDEHAVETRLELFRVPALLQPDAELSELGAHWRVYVLVRARYLMPGGLRQRGNSTHEGSADSENVDAHYSGAVAKYSLRLSEGST